MKTQEEIEKLANDHWEGCNGCDANDKYFFIKGFGCAYRQLKEDMADESIRFADWINKNDYEKIHGDRWCKKFMSYTHSTVELFEIFIKLNKQD